MPEFAYIARDLAGKKVAGAVSAGSEREVLAILTGQSLFPVEVRLDVAKKAVSNRRVRGQTMAAAYGQIASLLRAGVPLLRSLAVLREQASNAALKQVLTEIHAKVEEGTSLAEAMARYPRVFSEMAINMVRAGSEGGFLEEALDRVAQFTEQQEDLKGRTIGALAYPTFLACVGTVVVSGLIIFFVPKFAVMFDRLRQRGELPWLTDALLALSDFLRGWGLLIAFAVVVAILFLRNRLQTDAGRRQWDLIKLKLPIAGPIFRNLAVARFCRVLGTMLRNGVPILKSLEISREAAGNQILSEAIAEASENISSGQSLSKPLAGSGHFPPSVVEMISVAEEANTLDTVLVDLADGLERRTSRQLDLAVRLIEPIMLLILAGIVLMVVIALILPIVRMSSAM